MTENSSLAPKSVLKRKPFDFDRILNKVAAQCLTLLCLLPLLYTVWTAFHPSEYETRFSLFQLLTVQNFVQAWNEAPFARYFLSTFTFVTGIVAAHFFLCTLAAYAFARFTFPGRNVLFTLVLLQLLVMPDILIAQNYQTMRSFGLTYKIAAIGLPYIASGFGIFLLRQTFITVPKELNEAARVQGYSFLGVLWRVYIPLAKPTYPAYGLVSVRHHWNNFGWPLIVINSVETRPLTVDLSIFAVTDLDIQWSVINAATVMTSVCCLLLFCFSNGSLCKALFAQVFNRERS